jgi:hypothetical protein
MTRLLRHSDKRGVHAGDYRHVRVHFREELDSRAAGKRHDRIGFRDAIAEQFEEFAVALSFHGSRGRVKIRLVVGGQHKL